MSELSPRTIEQLQAMARKLRDDPSFMAWVLAAYQKYKNVTDAQLRKNLGANEHVLARLALCKRPLANSLAFRDDITQVAEYTNIDKMILLNIVRYVGALTAFADHEIGEEREVDSNQRPVQRGLMAATRDKSEPETSQSEKPETDREEGNDE